MKDLPLYLTLLRVLLAPIIFVLIGFYKLYFIGIALFLIASISDYFDGFLARKFKSETSFGKILDPLADKLLLLFMLFLIAYLDQSIFIFFVSSIMLAREFMMLSLRQFSAENKIHEKTDVSSLSKLKTTIQFLTILLILIGQRTSNSLSLFIGYFFLVASLLLSLKSFLNAFVSVYEIAKRK
jgi:CDP-diacylglycerol--glycerol-3-phosphate 3-phosphatidyltransferase